MVAGAGSQKILSPPHAQEALRVSWKWADCKISQPVPSDILLPSIVPILKVPSSPPNSATNYRCSNAGTSGGPFLFKPPHLGYLTWKDDK